MITRRDILIAVTTLLFTVTVIALAQSPEKPLMKSRVFQWADLKVESTRSGERRALFDGPTANMARFESHVTTLNPGEMPHPGHKHPEEEMMIVREGVVEAVLNDTTNRVEAGGLIFCASNEMHGLRNIGTNRATYYVIKWVPRNLKTAE
jgi:quercetin dioxygenase-like cupin family protein